MHDNYLNLLLSSIKGKFHTRRLNDAANTALGFPSHWPALIVSMVDEHALESLRWMLETAVLEGLPARTVLEAGVWRGGTAIFSAAVLKQALENTSMRAQGTWTVLSVAVASSQSENSSC
jgi:hypothetical protein